MRQKRKHIRFEIFIPCAHINTLENNAQSHEWGVIQNISAQGAQLATCFPIHTNDTLQLFSFGE
jgi:hypothetical protein